MELNIDMLGVLYGVSGENVSPFACLSSVCNLVSATKPLVSVSVIYKNTDQYVRVSWQLTQ